MRARAAWTAICLVLLPLSGARANGVSPQHKVSLRDNPGFKVEASPTAVLSTEKQVDIPRLVVPIIVVGHVIDAYANAERTRHGRCALAFPDLDIGLKPSRHCGRLGKFYSAFGKDNVSKATGTAATSFHAFRQEAVLLSFVDRIHVRKGHNAAHGIDGWCHSYIFGDYLELDSPIIAVTLEVARKLDFDLQRWSATSGEDFPVEAISRLSHLNGGLHIARLDQGRTAEVPKLSLASVPEFERCPNEPSSHKDKSQREAGDKEAFVSVHELARGGRQPRDTTNEWLAYGFVMLLLTPIAALVARRRVAIAWACSSLVLLLIGAVGGLIT